MYIFIYLCPVEGKALYSVEPDR